MPSYNFLRCEIYERASTTRIVDAAGDLRRVSHIRLTKLWPIGGLYGGAAFFVSRDADRYWPIKLGQRVTIRNGLKVVYEGYITGVDFSVQDNEQGRTVTCAGAWGDVVNEWSINKPWAETRLTEAVWVYQAGTTGAGDQSCTVDRLNRIRFTPKGVAWANGDYAATRYSAPTGQTVDRLKYNYDFQEAAQVWEISVWRSTDAAAWTQMTAGSGETYATGTTTVITASATSSVDVTLATPSQYIELRFYSRAAQTPVEDGTYYGQFSSIEVYTETGNINTQEIVKDVRAFVTALNSDENNIGALTQTLTPFVTEGQERVTAVINRALGFGDSSGNSWYCIALDSESAVTPDGKPVLKLAQYPVLTDYDYAVDMRGTKLRVVQSGKVENWIVVKYRDELNNRDVILTPDDNSVLTDATSVATYGRRVSDPLDSGFTTASLAAKWGARYLAAHKDVQFFIADAISVSGFIAGRNRERIPTSQIEPGKRLKIVNFLTDETAVSGSGLTFIITQVDYDDDTQTASLMTGFNNNIVANVATISIEQSSTRSKA